MCSLYLFFFFFIFIIIIAFSTVIRFDQSFLKFCVIFLSFVLFSWFEINLSDYSFPVFFVLRNYSFPAIHIIPFFFLSFCEIILSRRNLVLVLFVFSCSFLRITISWCSSYFYNLFFSFLFPFSFFLSSTAPMPFFVAPPPLPSILSQHQKLQNSQKILQQHSQQNSHPNFQQNSHQNSQQTSQQNRQQVVLSVDDV